MSTTLDERLRDPIAFLTAFADATRRPSLQTVTVTVGDEEEATDDDVGSGSWAGPIAFESVVVDDNSIAPRIMLPGSLGHRDLPLPFMALFKTTMGHDEAEVAGQIQAIDRRAWPELGEDAVAMFGDGIFEDDEFGRKARRYVKNRTVRGVSVDLVATEWAWVRRSDLSIVPDEDVTLEAIFDGEFYTGLVSGDIGAATLLPLQGFAAAEIELTASAAGEVGLAPPVAPFFIDFVDVDTTAVVAAAAAPPAPRASLFNDPHFDGPTPMSYDPETREVRGHMALWSGCHTGYETVCVTPPRSPSNYAVFNIGELECEDGQFVSCGKLMFSMDGGKHAPLGLGAPAKVRKHYDDTTHCGAYVRAGADAHGIWLSGVLAEGLSDAEIAHLRANPPSGDWRKIGGAMDLICAFSVAVPGYPVTRAEARVVASAEGDEIEALIIGPIVASAEGESRESLLNELIGITELAADLIAE